MKRLHDGALLQLAERHLLRIKADLAPGKELVTFHFQLVYGRCSGTYDFGGNQGELIRLRKVLLANFFAEALSLAAFFYSEFLFFCNMDVEFVVRRANDASDAVCVKTQIEHAFRTLSCTPGHHR